MCLAADGALAGPIFTAETGGNPAGDLAWQASTGGFVEADLDGIAHRQSLGSLVMGGVTLTLSQPGSSDAPFVFHGSYGGGGGQYGTVAGGALVAFPSLRIDFSQPVFGFGAWVFDDGSSTADAFTLGTNGGTSGVIDANPGSTGHAVDGFLGVTDANGITSLLIQNIGGGSGFELDHLQLAVGGPAAAPPQTPPATVSNPEPATAALLGLGALGLGLVSVRRRKRAAPQV